MKYTTREITWSEDNLQALMSAISFLRAHGRDLTADDLADLLLTLGGPNMGASRSGAR